MPVLGGRHEESESQALSLILLVFSGLVWFGIATASGLNMQSFFDFMRPIPKVITADLLLVSAFMKWLWRWKYLQGWLIPFPDLNGTWQGHIQTNWKDAKDKLPGPIPTILTIKQSFSRISCVMRTGEMESHSYLEGFCIDKEAQIRRLCYSYTSKPKAALRDRSTPHDGTILLNIVGSPVRKLEGEYWTQRHTTGTVTLTYRTVEILDEIPADLPTHPLRTRVAQIGGDKAK
ncbi:MAG: hypothetical protein V1800_10195 [Candidatus Latescibacterota bacterium]